MIRATMAMQLLRRDKSNQRLGTRQIDQHCKLDAAGDKVLRETMLRWHWSARAYHRVLKMARTIADLAGTQRISPAQVAEAIRFRRGLRER